MDLRRAKAAGARDGPAGCAAATVAAAIEPAGDLTGHRVGVFGLGMLGLTACAMAREAGAEIVIGLDPEPPRAEQAMAFGATAAGHPQDLPALLRAAAADGLDLVLEMSGAPQAVAAAMASAGIGRCALRETADSTRPGMIRTHDQGIMRTKAVLFIESAKPDIFRLSNTCCGSAPGPPLRSNDSP